MLKNIARIEKAIAKNKLFSFDFEAESKTEKAKDAKDPWKALPTLLSLCSGTVVEVLDATLPEVKALYVRLMTNSEYTALVFNANYDVILAHANGWLPFDDYSTRILDVLVLFWLFNEEEPHDLKSLVQKYLKYKMRTFDEVANGPHHRQILQINKLIALHDKQLQRWTDGVKALKVPYPLFRSPPLSWPAIKKMREEAAEPFGTVSQVGNEPFTKEAVFGEERRKRYEAWVARNKEKAETEIRRLREIINKEFTAYAADDSKQLQKLYKVGLSRVKKDGSLPWFKYEMAARMATIEMEVVGAPIDMAKHAEIAEKLQPLLKDFEQKVYELAKQEFKISSTQQLSRVLFLDCGVTPPSFSKVFCEKRLREVWLPKLNKFGTEYVAKHGVFDTNDPADVPLEIREKGLCVDTLTLERMSHPIAQSILNYRVASKLISTYIVSFKDLIHPDGRIHAGFNSVGTKTGRLSSNGPNLQNIPSRSKGSTYDERIRGIGKKLREQFVAPPPDEISPEGYVLCVADHSQIELRITTHFTRDPTLLRTYTQGVEIDGIFYYTGDIHAQTSASLAVPRGNAKVINFGFIYGMGASSFATKNKIIDSETNLYDFAKAASWRQQYFQTYHGIQSYIQDLKHHWTENGQREFRMLAPRKRHFTGYGYDLNKISGGLIFNSSVQGTSADIIKMNMYILNTYLKKRFPGFRIILQVHDELVCIVPAKHKEIIGKLIKYVMEYPFIELCVPILASAKLCDNWSAKDDDAIPEIGLSYALVDGKDHRVFDSTNWAEYVELDEQKRLSNKSSCARLTDADIAACREIIPDKGPIVRTS